MTESASRCLSAASVALGMSDTTTGPSRRTTVISWSISPL
nr:MAG TPA: hypothetical protein [Caudoviricetes sp.]